VRATASRGSAWARGRLRRGRRARSGLPLPLGRTSVADALAVAGGDRVEHAVQRGRGLGLVEAALRVEQRLQRAAGEELLHQVHVVGVHVERVRAADAGAPADALRHRGLAAGAAQGGGGGGRRGRELVGVGGLGGGGAGGCGGARRRGTGKFLAARTSFSIAAVRSTLLRRRARTLTANTSPVARCVHSRTVPYVPLPSTSPAS
jgi:hypothetical protein